MAGQGSATIASALVYSSAATTRHLIDKISSPNGGADELQQAQLESSPSNHSVAIQSLLPFEVSSVSNESSGLGIGSEDYGDSTAASNYLATSNNNTAIASSQQQPQQPELQLFLPLFALLVSINLIVILGNILVILAVHASAKLRNVTNIFIVSLATADLLLGLFVLPYALVYEVLDVWVFGEVWCRGWLVTDVWISTASILNLCAISIDRYVAVTRPVKYRSIMTNRRAKCIVAIVWILAFIICLPPLLTEWTPSGPSSVSSSSSSSSSLSSRQIDDAIGQQQQQQPRPQRSPLAQLATVPLGLASDRVRRSTNEAQLFPIPDTSIPPSLASSSTTESTRTSRRHFIAIDSLNDAQRTPPIVISLIGPRDRWTSSSLAAAAARGQQNNKNNALANDDSLDYTGNERASSRGRGEDQVNKRLDGNYHEHHDRGPETGGAKQVDTVSAASVAENSRGPQRQTRATTVVGGQLTSGPTSSLPLAEIPSPSSLEPLPASSRFAKGPPQRGADELEPAVPGRQVGQLDSEKTGGQEKGEELDTTSMAGAVAAVTEPTVEGRQFETSAESRRPRKDGDGSGNETLTTRPLCCSGARGSREEAEEEEPKQQEQPASAIVASASFMAGAQVAKESPAIETAAPLSQLPLGEDDERRSIIEELQLKLFKLKSKLKLALELELEEIKLPFGLFIVLNEPPTTSAAAAETATQVKPAADYHMSNSNNSNNNDNNESNDNNKHDDVSHKSLRLLVRHWSLKDCQNCSVHELVAVVLPLRWNCSSLANNSMGRRSGSDCLRWMRSHRGSLSPRPAKRRSGPKDEAGIGNRQPPPSQPSAKHRGQHRGRRRPPPTGATRTRTRTTTKTGTGTNRTARSGARRTTRSLGADFGASGTQRKTSGGEENPSVINGDNNNNSTTSGKIQAANMSRKWPGLVGLCFRFGGTSSVDEVEEEALDKRQTNNNDDDSSARGPLAAGGTTARQWRAGCLLHLMARLDFQKATNDEKGPPPTDGGRHQSIVSMDGARGAAHRLALALVVPLLAPNSSSMGCISTGPRDSEAGQCQCLALIGGSRRRELGQADARQEVEAGFNYSDLSSANAEAKNEPIAGQNEPQELVVKTVPHADYNTPSRTNKDRSAASGPNDLGTWEREQESGGGQVDELQGSLKELAEGDEQQEPKAGVRRVLPVIPDSSGPAGNQSVAVANVPGLQANLAERQLRNASARNEMTTNTTQPRVVVTAATTTPTLPEEAVGSEHFTSNRKMDSRRAAAERVVAVLSSGEQERIISSRANTKGARKEHDDEQQQHEQDEQEKQDQICCAAATVGTLSYSAAHVIVPEQDDDDDQQHEDCDLAALVELRRCHCLDTTASSSQTSNGKASRRCTSLNLDPESLAGAVHFLLEGPASSPVLYVHSVCKDAAAKIETSALSNREWPLAELLASSDNDKGGRLKACPEIGFVTVARLEATPIRGAGPNGIDYGRADKASGQHSSAAKKEEEASASEAAMKPTEAAPDLDPDLDLDSGFGRRPRRLNQEKPVLKSERPRRIVDNGIRENKERQARRGAPRHPLFRSRDVKMDHLLEAISSLAIGPAEEEEAAAARLATGSNDRTGTKAAPRAKTFVAPAANNEVQQSEQSESQSQKQQQRRGRHKHDPKNTNNNRKEKHDDDDDDDVNDYFGATQRARRAPIQSPVHGWHPRAHYPRVATLANSPQAGDETTRPAGLAGAPQLERPKGPRLVRATMMTRTTRTLGPVPVDVVGQAAIMSSLEYEQVAGSRPEGRAARSDPVNGQRPVGYVYGAGLQADSRSQVPPASASASASGARARVVELEKRDIDSKEEEEDVVSVQDDLVAAAAASNDDATSSTTGATTTPTKHTAQRYPMSEQAQTNASRRREKSGCTLFHDKTYVVYSALGSFFIPMLIMVFFYSRIYLVASRAQKAMQRGYMTTKWPPMTTHKSTANNNNHMRQQQGGPMGAGGGGKRKNWPRGSSFKRSSMIRASASTLRSSRTNSNENSASLITAGSHYNHHPESLSGGGQDPGGLGAEQASHECQPPERVMLRIHRRTEPPPQPQPQPQPQLQTSSLNSLQQKANSADLNYAGKMGVGANQQRQPITVAARLLRAISSDVSQDQTTSGVNKSSGLMALIVAEQQMALKRSGERRTRFSLDRTGESSGGSSAGRPTTGRQADEATLNQGQGFQPTRKRSSLPPAIKIAESALVNQLYEQEMNREQSELNRDNELTQVETTANQEPAAQIDASTELDQMRTISSPAAESGPSVGPDEGKESGRHHSSKHHNHHHHHHHHHHHRHHQNHHHHHHHHNRSHNHSNNNHKPDREDKRSPESTNLASSNLNGPPPSAEESIPQNSRQPDSANSIRITIEDASDSVQTRTEDDQTQAPEGDTASAPNGNGVASKEHWQSDNGSAQYGPMPTIVVNWDPESGQAASQLVAVAKEASSATTTPNTTNGRQLLASMPALQLLNDNNDDDVDVNVDGNQTHLDRLANVRIGFGTACSSPAYKRSLKEAHGLGSEDAEQGPHHHHHHQSYSGSGLSLVANIPQQVRKQSMMLLSSLTSRSGQTLRRLSMAAAHPVDTFLLKSRSSGPAGHRAAAGGGDHRRRRHRRRSSCSSNSSAATAASSSYLSTSCYSSTSVSSEAELDSIGGGGQKRPAARAGGITSRRSRAAAGSTLGDEQGPTEPTSGGSSTARPEHEGQPSERRRLFGGGSGKRRNNRNKRDKHSSLGNTSPMGPKKTLDDYLMAVAGIDTSSDEQDDDDDGDDDDVGDDEEDDDDDDSSMSSSSSSSTSSSSSSTFSGASNLTAMLRRENLLIPTIAIVSPDSDHSGSRLTLHELNAEPRSVASGANTNKLAKTCANDDKIDRDASSATNTTTTTTRAGQGCAPERAGQNHMEQKHDNLGSSLEKQVKRAEQLPPSAGLHRQGGLYESATSLRQSMQTSTNSTGLVTGTGIAGGTDDADKAQEVVVTAAGGKEPANHRHEPTTTLANESRPQTRSPDLFRLLDPRTRRELGAAKSGQLNATGGPSSRALVARVASSASGVTSSLISAQKITGGSSVTTGGGGAASAAATRRRGLKRTSRWHAKRLRAETKAAKTVAIIVGGFIFCWLPFFTAYLWRAIVCSSPNCIPQTWLSLSIWLGYMNSAINPVIYGLFSADFRQAFKSIVCRCRLRGHSHSPHHLHQHQQAAGNDTAVVSMLVDGILKSFL